MLCLKFEFLIFYHQYIEMPLISYIGVLFRNLAKLSNSFFVDSITIFYIDKHVICKYSLLLSFSAHMPFILFLPCDTKNSSIMLIRIGESGYSCLFPHLKWKSFNLLPLSFDVSYVFCRCPLSSSLMTINIIFMFTILIYTSNPNLSTDSYVFVYPVGW